MSSVGAVEANGEPGKIAVTFEQSDGETICTFHLYNSPRETDWQCTLNK